VPGQDHFGAGAFCWDANGSRDPAENRPPDSTKIISTCGNARETRGVVNLEAENQQILAPRRRSRAEVLLSIRARA
jgi:hypothetical protein